jgi:hypothetical protein
MGPFERIGSCGSCGQEYTVSGAALAPGAETESPARFFCTCGGFVETFLPGSVNRERVVLLPRDEALTPSGS